MEIAGVTDAVTGAGGGGRGGGMCVGAGTGTGRGTGTVAGADAGTPAGVTSADAAASAAPLSAPVVRCRHCQCEIRRRARRRRILAGTVVNIGGGRMPARGLCQRCYHDPDVRPRYPLIGMVDAMGRRRNVNGTGHGGLGGCDDEDGDVASAVASGATTIGRGWYDSAATRPLPPMSTDAMPGSDKKLEVMEERAKQGYALWHPNDMTVNASLLAEFGFTLAGLVQVGGDRSTRTRCLEVLGPTTGLNMRNGHRTGGMEGACDGDST